MICQQILYCKILEQKEVIMKVLSVDLGASSGRCFVSKLRENNIIAIEEIHRFENGIINIDVLSCWNLDRLWQDVYKGIRKSIEKYDDICSIGVDSWAVDFVCLDENDTEIRPYISYRDMRTKGMIEEFCTINQIDKQALFSLTAAQLLELNSLYQLFALKQNNPKIFSKINKILMIPDWFHYKLTGKKVTEFTNASTTQMLDAQNKRWSPYILDALTLTPEQLPPIFDAGTQIGWLTQDVQSALNAKQKIAVTLPATHDTASAVVAVPSVDAYPYFISLGTWAIVGQEMESYDVAPKNLQLAIGNEGGVFDTYRKSKNVTGLWLIQNVKKELCSHMDYGDIVSAAEESSAGQSLIFPNDSRFSNPISMVKEIQKYCAETQQYVPQTIGEISRCIFDSLACCLADSLMEIAQDKSIPKIYAIGGGARNHHLCQTLADIMKIEVSAGPFEATVIGNAAMQLIGLGAIPDIITARKIIAQSFPCKQLKPEKDQTALWDKYHHITKK